MSDIASKVTFQNITKRFGDFVANEDITFQIARQSIHAIVGENGAGKSTLMKMLFGLYHPDSGSILIDGKPVSIPSAKKAIAMGIGMVHQHFKLIPELPAWQNLILGCEPSLVLKPKQIIKQLDEWQKSLGFEVNLTKLVGDLPVGVQQQIEILKSLYRNAEILILDEPTAVLTPVEAEMLFKRLKHLKEKGKTILLVSHKLEDVLKQSDRVTVMRLGKVVDTQATSSLTESTLACLIVGRELKRLPSRQNYPSDDTRLQFDKVSCSSLKELTFSLKAGEILGIAGISGNGQDEILEHLYQMTSPHSGNISFLNLPLTDYTPYENRDRGLAILPSDRLKEGIILQMTLSENLLLGMHRGADFQKYGFFRSKQIQIKTKEILREFDVRFPNDKVKIKKLSGGNQQKLVFAREVSRHPKVIIASYPTRGVDVGASEFIHSYLIRERNQGTAVLLFSSDLDEIFQLSDRIMTLFRGKVMGTESIDKLTRSQVGLWMTGVA